MDVAASRNTLVVEDDIHEPEFDDEVRSIVNRFWTQSMLDIVLNNLNKLSYGNFQVLAKGSGSYHLTNGEHYKIDSDLDFMIYRKNGVPGILGPDESMLIHKTLESIADAFHKQTGNKQNLTTYNTITYKQGRVIDMLDSWDCPSQRVCQKKAKSYYGKYYITHNYSIPHFVLFRLKMKTEHPDWPGIPLVDISFDFTNVSLPNLPTTKTWRFSNILFVNANGYLLELLARYIMEHDNVRRMKLSEKILKVGQAGFVTDDTLISLMEQVLEDNLKEYFWNGLPLQYYSTDYQFHIKSQEEAYTTPNFRDTDRGKTLSRYWSKTDTIRVGGLCNSFVAITGLFVVMASTFFAATQN